MTTRINTIIKKARYALADPDSVRYSDARLLSLLDSAQKDIARQTRLLKDTMSIPLAIGQADYTMPADTWLITRATFDNELIPLVSHDKLDSSNPRWSTDAGPKVEAIVYDRRNVTSIKVYPIPNKDYVTNSYTVSPVEGVTVSVGEEPAVPIFGVLTALGYTSLFSPSVYGVVTDINTVTGILRINYIKDAPDLLAANSELVLSSLFDTALEYFVTGRAFMDDLDTQYQNKGVAVMTMYQRELDTVGAPTKETDGTQSTQYSPNYISVFDQ